MKKHKYEVPKLSQLLQEHLSKKMCGGSYKKACGGKMQDGGPIQPKGAKAKKQGRDIRTFSDNALLKYIKEQGQRTAMYDQKRLDLEKSYADQIIESGLLGEMEIPLNTPNMPRSTTAVDQPLLLEKMKDGGGIHIKKSRKGTFTAAATKHGKGVQEFARQVLANKDNYSSAMVKKANFARNFGGKKKNGGPLPDILKEYIGKYPAIADIYEMAGEPMFRIRKDGPPEYDPNTNIIYLPDEDYGGEDTILHELHHAYQRNTGQLAENPNIPESMSMFGSQDRFGRRREELNDFYKNFHKYNRENFERSATQDFDFTPAFKLEMADAMLYADPNTAEGEAEAMVPHMKRRAGKKNYDKKFDLGGFLQNLSPLISAIPGAGAPIGAGMNLLGSIIDANQQDNSRLYALNQMKNGGPVDPPGKPRRQKILPYDFNPPVGSPGDKIARQQYGKLVNNPAFGNTYLEEREDQLGRLMLSASVAHDKSNARNPNRELELVKQFNTTGKPEAQIFSFAQQHAIDKARRALEQGVGYSGVSFDKMRDMKRRKMKMGGDFKQYDAPGHELGGQMIDMNGNPTMNTPVAEIEKSENSYDGYVYSDTLINPDTGNTYAKDAKKVANKTKGKDDISKSSRVLQLMKLRMKNEDARLGAQTNEEGVPLAEEGLPFLPTRRGEIVAPPRKFEHLNQLMFETDPNSMFYTVGVDDPATTAQVEDRNLIPDQEVSATNTGLGTLNTIAAGLKGAALGYGAIDALRSPEQEKLQLPDYSKGDQYYRNLDMDLAPALGEINMAATKATQDVSNQASGIGSRNARVASILSRAGKNAAQTQLQQQSANNQVRAMLGQREDQKSNVTAAERIRQQTAQSQNDATARLAERKFFSDLSQVGTTLNNIQYANDMMKNQNELGKQAIQYGLAVLSQKYPNFKPSDDFMQRLQSGTLTEADKPMLDQLIQFINSGQ